MFRTNDVAERIIAASTRLVDDLKARFGQLDLLISEISGSPEISVPPGAQPGLNPRDVLMPLLRSDNSQPQQQQRLPEVLVTRPIPGELAAYLARAGREYGSASSMTTELDAYIQAAVIVPAFELANIRWQQDAYVIRGQAQKAIAGIGTAREKLSQIPALLAALETSIEGLDRVAGELHLAPPGNSGWWRTVGDKETSVAEMIAMVQHQLGEANTAEAGLAKILSELEAAIAADDKLAREIDQSIEALNKQAVELQAQLSAIGGPFEIVSFGLATLAPLLPVIIAVASGFFVLLITRALHRMRLAVERATTEGERRLLQPWLLDAAGRNERRAALWSLVATLVMTAWMWSVARSTGTLPVPLLSPVSFTAFSIVLIAAFRVVLLREATLALRVQA